MGFAGTVRDGHEDRRGTRIAARPKQEETDGAKAFTMGYRGAGEAAEKAGLSDCAAGGVTRAKPIKIARECIVIIGSRTAIILTFLVRRDPDEGVSGC